MLLVVVLVAALVVTLALALVVLPTQGEEHTLQSLAGTHVSVPHACVLHGVVCMRSGQVAPVPCGNVSTERVEMATPPPHVAEHVDGGDQADTTQSIGPGLDTGHACVAHTSVVMAGPHSSVSLWLLTVRVLELAREGGITIGEVFVVSVATAKSSGVIK